MGVTMQLKVVEAQRLTEMIDGGGDPDGYLFEAAGSALDLGRSWYALHYLLCGEVWTGEGPLFDALSGGQPLLQAEELVRALTTDQTEATAQALNNKTEEQLTAAFRPEEMNAAKIYPSADWTSPGELEHLLERFRELTAYYGEAAAKRQGMLLYSF